MEAEGARTASDSLTTLRKSRSIIDIQNLLNTEKPSLLVVYNSHYNEVVAAVGEVLGQKWKLVHSREAVRCDDGETVLGIPVADFQRQWNSREEERTVINTHCFDALDPPDDTLTDLCHYEYLYTASPLYRRPLVRFLSHVLGQRDLHCLIDRKFRSTLLCTNMSDVREAIPNLEILTVGADGIELRVDLLREKQSDGSSSSIPSLFYVGKQLALLRQHTALPIIFIVRSTAQAGEFPSDDPSLIFKYLYKAKQWGCPYLDVELWLLEEDRHTLWQQKGSTKIISTFVDTAGELRWTEPLAVKMFDKAAASCDLVKMTSQARSNQDNHDLENFRSKMRSKYPQVYFLGYNTGPEGRLSQTLNRIMTPVTHHLIPSIANPDHLTVAELNQSLFKANPFPKLDFFVVGHSHASLQAIFYEKCFNELGLPHKSVFLAEGPQDNDRYPHRCIYLADVSTDTQGPIESILQGQNFGGICFEPSIPTSSLPNTIELSESSQATDQVSIVAISLNKERKELFADNLPWRGIRATLLRDFAPSAYSGRTALVLANTERDAVTSVYALKSTGLGQIYTIGFKPQSALCSDVVPLKSIDELQRFEAPVVIISALPSDKSHLVGPLLKHYGGNPLASSHASGKVFIDLAKGHKRAEALNTATALGWMAYGVAEVNAFTVVVAMLTLVEQLVPCGFVKLAYGSGIYGLDG